MTEKRFNVVDLLETLAIADGDECKYYQNSNDDWLQLKDLLNSLNDENKQLRKLTDIGDTNAKAIVDVLNDQETRIRDLKKENEQLKSSNMEYEDALARLEEKNERLELDKTRCHQAMSRLEVKHKQFKEKVYNLIDEKIDEYYQELMKCEKGEGWGDNQRYLCYSVALTNLKKELQK